MLREEEQPQPVSSMFSMGIVKESALINTVSKTGIYFHAVNLSAIANYLIFLQIVLFALPVRFFLHCWLDRLCVAMSLPEQPSGVRQKLGESPSSHNQLQRDAIGLSLEWAKSNLMCWCLTFAKTTSSQMLADRSMLHLAQFLHSEWCTTDFFYYTQSNSQQREKRHSCKTYC